MLLLCCDLASTMCRYTSHDTEYFPPCILGTVGLEWYSGRMHTGLFLSTPDRWHLIRPACAASPLLDSWGAFTPIFDPLGMCQNYYSPLICFFCCSSCWWLFSSPFLWNHYVKGWLCYHYFDWQSTPGPFLYGDLLQCLHPHRLINYLDTVLCTEDTKGEWYYSPHYGLSGITFVIPCLTRFLFPLS